MSCLRVAAAKQLVDAVEGVDGDVGAHLGFVAAVDEGLAVGQVGVDVGEVAEVFEQAGGLKVLLSVGPIFASSLSLRPTDRGSPREGALSQREDWLLVVASGGGSALHPPAAVDHRGGDGGEDYGAAGHGGRESRAPGGLSSPYKWGWVSGRPPT